MTVTKYWRAAIADIVVQADNEEEGWVKLNGKLKDWRNLKVFEFSHDEDLDESLNEDTTQDGNDPWERCDACSRKTHPNELALYKGICADCALGKLEAEQ